MEAIDFGGEFWQGKRALTDSRQAVEAGRQIFFARLGPQHNGHDYIPALYEKGLRHFVVEEGGWEERYPKAEFLHFPDSLAILQAWAAWHRQQFEGPILGIAGSNGKTIIKEWLYQLLSPHLSLLKSPKSYNSQLGVALSLLELRKEHQLGLIEAGISKAGEMQRLAKMISPQYGLFSNLGSAHDEGFANRSEKLAEKMRLFEGVEQLVYCLDQRELAQYVAQHFEEDRRFSWGRSPLAKLQLLSEKKQGSQSILRLAYAGEEQTVVLPFWGKAAIENAMQVLSFCLLWGLSWADIQAGFRELRKLPMRLSWKKGSRDCLILDDSYSNDLLGLRHALEFMAQHQEHRFLRPSIILSDIMESGQEEEQLYAEVAQLLEQYQIERILGIGAAMQRQQAQFDFIPERNFYPNTEQALAALVSDELLFQSEYILVKGARSFRLERLSQRLLEQRHRSVLELSKSAILHNLRTYKQQLKPSTRLMVMVKAFAYGSSYEMAHLLANQGVDYFGVAYADEGVRLRKEGIQQPIMVMNSENLAFEDLLQFSLAPSIFSLAQLKAFVQFLERYHYPAHPIHIELDTGMHRLGFEGQELPALLAFLKEKKQYIQVAGIFSHLAAADEAEQQTFTHLQAQRFAHWAEQIEAILEEKPLRHLLNSAGISAYADYQYDMVRLGIGLHGVDPAERLNLQAVARLRSQVSQVKQLEAGEAVGYGRAATAPQAREIATLAIGYGDGLPRGLGNGKGQVYIGGRLCPLVGNVCMDMCFADVSGLRVRAGDKAIFFGPELPIEGQAKALDSIPYELLTRIGPRVPRLYYED